MAHRIVNGPAAWLGACLLALVSASAADAQTRSGPPGAMPPTGTGTAMGMPPTGMPPAGGATTTTEIEDGRSALTLLDRMVILMQAIEDVSALVQAFGVQDVGEFEFLMFVVVMYEQRVAVAEEEAAAGFDTPGSFGSLFGGLFGGR